MVYTDNMNESQNYSDEERKPNIPINTQIQCILSGSIHMESKIDKTNPG